MKNRPPALTVIMQCLNAAAYIEEAVDSILCQTLEDFEFIILDDGSSDGTLECLRRYTDPRIRLVSCTHGGVAVRSNEGLAMARGELVARMDADDVALPHRLQRQYEFMQSHPEVGVVGSWYEEMDEHGRKQAVRRLPVSHAEIHNAMPVFCVISHGCALYRRSTVALIGGYNQQLLAGSDTDLWLRLFAVTQFHNIPEVLMKVRRQIPSLSTRARRDQVQAHVAAALRYLTLQEDAGSRTKEDAQFQRARLRYYHGGHDEARAAFLVTLKQKGYRVASIRYLVPLLVFGRCLERLRTLGILSYLTDPLRRIPFIRRHVSP